jgi:hypothetical protein
VVGHHEPTVLLTGAAGAEVNPSKQLSRKRLRVVVGRAEPSASPVAHQLPNDTCQTAPLDPDQAAWLAARDRLPEVVRNGLVRWETLPRAVQAVIEAALETVTGRL